MRNYIILAAAVLLLAGTASAAQGQPFQILQNDIDSINDALLEVALTTAGINGSLEQLTQHVENNTAQIQNNTLRIDSLSSSTAIDLLDQALTQTQELHANDTQRLDGRIDALNDTQQSQGQSLADLRADTDNNSALIDSFFDVFTDINLLNDTLTQLSAQHAQDTQALSDDIDAINLTCEQKSADLQAQIDSLEARLDALENSTSVGGQGNESQECTDGETRLCGSDVGACTQGTETCTDGEWGACLGAVGPSAETCNDIDDDCDGIVDNLNGTTKQCKEIVCKDSSLSKCDGVCVDLTTDNNNCGTCGNPCLSGETCEAGACTALEDQDADGYTSDVDCDDTNPSINPGATETWYDGVDQDCDGADDYDQDMDGYQSSAHGGLDCDDTDASVHPGATEVCDGKDNDCSGTVPDNEIDHDEDGYVECSIDGTWQGDPAVIGGADCNDTDSTVSPGSTEACNDIDDDCDGTADEGDVCGLECTEDTDCASGPNSGAFCVENTCQLSCDPGFGDCNGDPADGCEVELGDQDSCESF